MIDSINFILNNVTYLDMSILMKLGIKYYKLKYQKSNNGKMYVKYGNVKESVDAEEFSVSGIGFSYMNIFFRYLPQFDCIIITTHTQKILGKTDILLSDRDSYINDIKHIIKILFNAEFSQLQLHRIDYCVDIEMDYKIMYEYLQLLYKHTSKYQHIKRINNYETSIYITSLYGQQNINIYDKYQCEKDKYNKEYQKAYRTNGISIEEYKASHPAEYEKYKNILRIEVQNTKKLIKQQAKCFIDKDNKDEYIDLSQEHKKYKSMYGYWNKESMQTYYFDFLKPFLYSGNYYKLKKAKQMIKKAETVTINGKVETISEYLKSQLKEFITIVNQYGITNAIKTKDTDNIPQWHIATIDKYESDLEEIGINYLEIDIKRKKALKAEKEKIEKSNHSQLWKKQLIEFIIAIGKYGITEITTKKNKEVTSYGRVTMHKRWCKATVENYIAILEGLGINPVTLNNDSEFDSLEGLYTLSKKVAEQKYFNIDKLDMPEPVPPKEPVAPMETKKELLKSMPFQGVVERRRYF